MRCRDVAGIILAATMVVACATEWEQGEVAVDPSATDRAASGEEILEQHEVEHYQRMDEDTEILNAKIAREQPDAEWQARVRDHFHSQWQTLYPERTEIVFTQDFTCSTNLCAALVEIPAEYYMRSVSNVIKSGRDAELALWGRTATRPENGDELRIWIFLWRPGVSRL